MKRMVKLGLASVVAMSCIVPSVTPVFAEASVNEVSKESAQDKYDRAKKALEEAKLAQVEAQKAKDEAETAMEEAYANYEDAKANFDGTFQDDADIETLINTLEESVLEAKDKMDAVIKAYDEATDKEQYEEAKNLAIEQYQGFTEKLEIVNTYVACYNAYTEASEAFEEAALANLEASELVADTELDLEDAEASLKESQSANNATKKKEEQSSKQIDESKNVTTKVEPKQTTSVQTSVETDLIKYASLLGISGLGLIKIKRKNGD